MKLINTVNNCKIKYNEPKPSSPEKLRDGGFKSLFNNRIGIASTRIGYAISTDHTKLLPLREEALAVITAFLNDLEHHYTTPLQSKDLAEAYDFLRSYLKRYPNVIIEESVKALEMVDRIYAAVGLKRITADWGTKKSCVLDAIKERFRKVIIALKSCVLQVVKQMQDWQSSDYVNQHSLIGGKV